MNVAQLFNLSRRIGMVFLLAFVSQIQLSGSANAQDESPTGKLVSTTVRFLDSADKPVTSVNAIFYNGGRAKTLEIENGITTIEAADGIVVARADGFQYSGTILNGSGIAKVVLLRDDEKHEAVANEAYPLTDAIRQQTLSTVAASLWERLAEDPNDRTLARQALQILGRIEPQKTLAYLKDHNLDPQSTMGAKGSVIDALFDSDLESGMELIEGIGNPMMRSMMIGKILTDLPEGHSALPTIEKQLANAALAVKQPAYRLISWAILAEHYWATDRPKLTKKIVQQQMDDVKKLPADGWTSLPRSMFAALIVKSDPDLAMSLIEGIKTKNEKPTAAGRLAFHCCRTAPKRAIELLRDNPNNPKEIMFAHMSIDVARRMAVEQTAAATQLADSIDEPNQRAWAYGMMAWRLNDSDPKMARELLTKAIETLDQDQVATYDSFQSRSATLAGLLPIANIVSPGKVRPMIWQAASHALPRTRWKMRKSHQSLIQNAAGAIARYDRALAKALLRDHKIDSGQGHNSSAAHQAAIDPEGLAEYFLRIRESDNPREFRSYESLVEVLQGDESEFWLAVSKPTWLPWPSKTFQNY